MKALDGVAIRTFADLQEWESWLADHHEETAGIWLKMAKKDSGVSSISPDDVLDGALCYGWISGQRRSYDQNYYLQKYTPRRPRSVWSKINVEKVEALTAAGRMREPGLAEVAAAQADGRWAVAYERQKTAKVPSDLAAALKRNKQAREVFQTLNKTERYLVILRLLTARTPEIRSARLRKQVADLGQQSRSK